MLWENNRESYPQMRPVPIISIFFAAACALQAVTVDLYQDCESGTPDEFLTPSIMSASAHGTGTWSAEAGTMCVSGIRSKQLPGTVTVGTMTFVDTGTRTWVVSDRYDHNNVRVSINAPAGHVSATLSLFLTVGPTIYFTNNFDS